MSEPALDVAARAVLEHYPAVARTAPVIPLGNHGGFSGAQIWRVLDPAGPLCLRAWPSSGPSTARLRSIHDLMQRARAEGLHCVPALLPALHESFVEHAGRLWELTTWMPGVADFHARPGAARLRAAAETLARLHNAWISVMPSAGPCPALRRRLERLGEWNDLVRSGWQVPVVADGADPLRHLAERGWRVVMRWAVQVPAQLARWLDRSFRLAPCLCDIWHDHVLFEGDRVSGIIDYGAIKFDHASVDLARLLGSLVGDDEPLWRIGLRAYTSLRPLTEDEEALSRALDRTGVVLGVGTWLKWLYWDRKPFADRGAVARHLGELVERIERWT